MKWVERGKLEEGGRRTNRLRNRRIEDSLKTRTRFKEKCGTLVVWPGLPDPSPRDRWLNPAWY